MNLEVAGRELNVASIESNLAALWRQEADDAGKPVTRAALWNVVVRSDGPRDQQWASSILSDVSARVPQRSIVIRAEDREADSLTSWINANCHRVGKTEQVCSEEIVIAAGGKRVMQVPPIVNALLVPDMPVAVWWIGDLPDDHDSYVCTLFESADRVIVDSKRFDGASDFTLLRNLARSTKTAPADLNWERHDAWRVATAALFDSPQFRGRAREVKRLRLVGGADDATGFGAMTAPLLHAAWFLAQTGIDRGSIDLQLEVINADHDGVLTCELELNDGTSALMNRDGDVVRTSCDRTEVVSRLGDRSAAALISRQLMRPRADKVFAKALAVAEELARTTR